MKTIKRNCYDSKNLFLNETICEIKKVYYSNIIGKATLFANTRLPFILLIFIYLFCFNISHAETKALYATVMNGSWSSTSIWNPTACPSLSDDITIIHSVANFTNLSITGSILIESSGTLSSLDMIVSNGAVLIISGTLNLDNLTLNNGSTLCILPSGVVAISGDFDNKNNTINVVVGGNLIVGGNFTNGYGGIISGSGAIFVSGIFDGAGTTFSISPTSSIPPNSTIQIELPIELLDFDVVATENDIIINWKTVSEINNDYFTIEKSSDCIFFTELARVVGAGNSNSIQEYTFSDIDMKEKISYYRLKQTDFDGQFKYCSQILAVSGNSEDNKISDVAISPCPFTENFYIQFFSENQESYILKIFDANNKCVFTNKLSVNAGINRHKINHLNSAPKGVYIIGIFKNKDKIYFGKILKY
ncbi:MAG: hypothetical protein A2275_04585 [Bacteroidetes bacterium RIFOXYA12_FULL_35_11]|nr:MAG: hypothetical protein A2X01_13830 [Bacteroidetes bacterium GWF2_35_48]OFY75620.1 MAG: hypothetical protein A2275_04585 [Bacteroidetes bacterium RIFOXYA12_FULL_35_11]OFY94930.1 MAG: hypothetical protein A2491_12035 [Bacteroidetes bacterium RIFOXYC12_FULL_35_7]OFY95622.1 MAG: hypothetical protein A2309_00775 [Bacteroidetes bacterium RIFOXYB2_FULL_35_7]HBX52080.1 hypothetical protein [Bacteroidales bacterium]